MIIGKRYVDNLPNYLHNPISTGKYSSVILHNILNNKKETNYNIWNILTSSILQNLSKVRNITCIGM